MEAATLERMGRAPARAGNRTEDTLSGELTDLDRELLELVSWLRVVTQTQLERLLPDVPDRTLRYRTRRLHRLRLLGRSRPYRDRGTAPHHLWPTNRADALVRGRPRPQRGERRPPNPLFLAHTAAISELYVVLKRRSSDAGLTLSEFHREGEAREAFTDSDERSRAIAPDVRIRLCDAGGGVLHANVELDLGTMSHARLRTKLDGYLRHAQQVARKTAAGVPPVLLLVTTSDVRADAICRSVAAARARPPFRQDAARLEIAVSDVARELDRLLTARSWRTSADDRRLSLGELVRGRVRR